MKYTPQVCIALADIVFFLWGRNEETEFHVTGSGLHEIVGRGKGSDTTCTMEVELTSMVLPRARVREENPQDHRTCISESLLDLI